MDIIRRDTDYALRMMVMLASSYDTQPISARVLAKQSLVSYSLACKLLQRLHKAGFIKSTMGPKGGFTLTRNPSEINLWQIIEIIQGPVSMNKCLLGDFKCQNRGDCSVYDKLVEVQRQIKSSLTATTLDELLLNRKTENNSFNQHLKDGKK